jgi:hypothetical protein
MHYFLSLLQPGPGRVKQVAASGWLGNDETHYLRKWETKELTDLKKLIQLTVHWIQMERLTDGIVDDKVGRKRLNQPPGKQIFQIPGDNSNSIFSLV